MSKVFLGVGHGGSDPGAVSYLVEKDVNLNVAIACRDYLEKHNVQVAMSRTTDENDTLTEEIRECNAYNPDLAADIHNNAGGGDGCEVFHSINGGTGKVLAENINQELVNIGQNSRGCKVRKNSTGTADYYGFIRQTKAPAVIVECAFVDNKADAEQIDTISEQVMFGQAIAKGILKTLGIEINTQETTEKPTGTKSKIAVDGTWGKETTKRAQEVFGTTVDSIVSNQYLKYKSQNPGLLSSSFEWKEKPNKSGSNLIKAIQKKVGTTVDGSIGPKTITAMQKWLGTKQDGFVSNPSNMVKVFQNWLNNQ